MFHIRDHSPLRVVAVVYVHSGGGCLVRCIQECIEAVEHGLELTEPASFLELRLYTVDFIF